MSTNSETMLSARLLKLVHTHNHNTCIWPIRGSERVNMTKVCRDQPIRHQEKLFSANLDNLKGGSLTG